MKKFNIDTINPLWLKNEFYFNRKVLLTFDLNFLIENILLKWFINILLRRLLNYTDNERKLLKFPVEILEKNSGDCNKSRVQVCAVFYAIKTT